MHCLVLVSCELIVFRVCLDPMRQVLQQWSTDLWFITVKHVDCLRKDVVENLFVGNLVLMVTKNLLVVLVKLERPLADTPD